MYFGHNVLKVKIHMTAREILRGKTVRRQKNYSLVNSFAVMRQIITLPLSALRTGHGTISRPSNFKNALRFFSQY